jgi:two-component system, NarL family, sensor kinase
MYTKSLNENFLVIIIVTIVFLILSGFIIIFVLWYQRRKRENKDKIIEITQRSEQMKAQYQQEILRTQLEIQEQTLKTISQEIHDNIGQVLSLAKLNLNTIDTTKQDELKEKITDSKNLVSKAIHDLRDLSKSLNTDNIVSMGLLRGIEYELDMIRKTGFETLFDVSGNPLRMEPQKELIVFRIIQETLNNIMKHAEAKKIIISAIYTSDKLELLIKDNGKGVDLTPLSSEANTNMGLGIRNMHNRAKMIGADFSMSSSIGNGTTVKLIIPLTNQSN